MADIKRRKPASWEVIMKSTHQPPPRLGAPCEPEPQTHILNKAAYSDFPESSTNSGGEVIEEPTEVAIEYT